MLCLPQAMQYMELLPEDRQPVAGTEGALYRHIQLMRQLPFYDQDPTYCHSLSEAELNAMAQFVRSYKDEALGVGEIALPGEGGKAKQKDEKALHSPQQSYSVTTVNGTTEENNQKNEYVSI